MSNETRNLADSLAEHTGTGIIEPAPEPEIEIPDVHSESAAPTGGQEIQNQRRIHSAFASGESCKLRILVQVLQRAKGDRPSRYHDLVGEGSIIVCRTKESVEWVRGRVREAVAELDGMKVEVEE